MMSKYEERLKERLPEAAKIARGLRQKAGIVDDKSDMEICSLQEIYNCWEKLMETDYVERKRKEMEQLVDVRDIAKDDTSKS